MLKEHLKVIVKELQEACDGYDETNDAPIIESIMHSGKIFIAGAGRTGYIMRCFAMRLIHLGFCAYVIGDTEMIAAKAGDLLLIGSGSGETKTLRVYMEKAKQLLKDARFKITDISSRVGYSDGNYFGKSFKKYSGLSPSEYRERNLQ